MELILSAAGILVILILPGFFVSAGGDIWKAATITAAAVGVLHGIIFWVIRRRQRAIREIAINEIKVMLRDQINNRLTTVTLQVEAQVRKHPNPETLEIKENLASITQNLRGIAEILKMVSEESLSRWKQRYSKQ